MQIQNMSVNDGEGIRTTVFFAGCPLRCRWCSNPEGKTQDNPMVHYAEKEEILDRVRSQRIFYRYSGGGVTFSGGEATMQPDFLNELTQILYDEGDGLALETCGLFDFERVLPSLKRMETVFMDIKHFDPQRHQEFTGVENQKILENIQRTVAAGIPVVVRIPVIHGVNANDRDLEAIFSFMKDSLPGVPLEMLPYHRYGEDKYRELGLVLPDAGFGIPTESEMNRW